MSQFLKTFMIIYQKTKGENMIYKKNFSKKSEKIFKNDVDFSETFRHNIWKYAEQKSMTIVDVANKSQIPINTINSFLHHVSNDMKVSNVSKIAKTLNISIDELVGADTLPELTKESIQICRDLPDNDLLLVRWFIRCLNDLNSKTEPNKRYITVMLPELDNNGDCKLISKFEKMEITDLKEPLRSKIFIGFRIISDYYMPYYYPDDIILIANDRPPMQNEHVVVRAGDYIFIVKRIFENGVARYYSVRDGKYRIDESEVDELIGYIVLKV